MVTDIVTSTTQTKQAAPNPEGQSPEDRRQEAAYREELLIGPPGCGKTTELARQVRLAVDQAKTVLVCSLTKASAAEVAGRDLRGPAEAVGTLHSHCFYALGQPLIAHEKVHLEDWNAHYPAFALTVNPADKARSLDEDNLDPAADNAPGDDLMAKYQIIRSRMQTPPPESDVGQFAQAWNDWKSSNALFDFTDLIETCLRDTDAAPSLPDVIYVDEAQDMDLLEMTLVRKWSQSAGHLVAVGDPDQAIYIWRGADPKAFSTPATADSTIHVLEQSYRVPKHVHHQAVSWINRIIDRRKITYYPRPAEGEFRRSEANFRFPEQAIQDAEQHIQDGKTVMFLASCSYMLTNLINALKRTGTPFWNPNRRSNGAWNPLQRRANTTTASDRILAYLGMYETSHWTAEDIHRWTNAVKLKGVIQHGGRQAVKDLKDDSEGTVSWDTITDLFTTQALEAALTGDLDWYEENLVSSKKQPAIFPLAIARNRGPQALETVPQIVVGTIHSAKGSEADVIYLFPDVSRAGMVEWTGSHVQQASVFRLFYVAMTRAREKLVICNPATRAHVNI